MSMLIRTRCMLPVILESSSIRQHALTSFHSRLLGPRLGYPLYSITKSSPFSTSSAALSTKSTASSSNNTRRVQYYRLLARLAYYARIPFLVLSVYSIGYQQGIMDYSRDPKKMQYNLLDTILAGVGCINREGVLVANEGEWRALLSSDRHRLHGDDSDEANHARAVMIRNVSMVGERIVKVARSYVKQKLEEAVRESSSKLPPDIDEAHLYEALEYDEEVERWTRALRHMEAPWKYVLIPTDLPNAFVSEILRKENTMTSYCYFIRG
eukprot:scaffold39524_cov62-Cyclotella_meneghiniana.AAC.4